jgi:DnaJ family protein B protein 4
VLRTLSFDPKQRTKIRFEGLGDEDQDGEAGALVFVVAQKPDPNFNREGDDLIYTHTITLAEALAGPEPEHDLNRGLKHLDGRNVVFKLPHIGATGGRPIWPGFEIRIPGQGMPITRKSAGRLRGDLRVQIHVTFPAWLSAAQIQAARQLKECMSLHCSFTSTLRNC